MDSLTYAEENEIVWSWHEVQAVLAQHSIDTHSDFRKEVGIKSEYTAVEVLKWLGY